MTSGRKKYGLSRQSNLRRARQRLHLIFGRPSRAIALTSLTALIFLLPGQNLYQTLAVEQFPPLVRSGNSLPKITGQPYPLKINSVAAPQISARAVVVVDLRSAAVLFEKNPQLRLRPASTTKLMTALVALDYFPPDQILATKRLSTDIDESEMGLAVGDRLTVQNLLYGLLIPSGNDAALTLADNYPGGVENFIYSMNKRARELHLLNTHFDNPVGTDSPNQFSTAGDLALLAREVLKDPLLSKIVRTNWAAVWDAASVRRYPLQNVNRLLTTLPGEIGLKTGFTEEAGQCLVSATTRDGQTIITVVLGSDDRFIETSRLTDWAFASFRPTDPRNLPVN